MKKIIFDLGCSVGDNFEYLLSKADLVIGVEANPDLFLELNRKFLIPIRHKKLILYNYVLTNSSKKKCSFYKSKLSSSFSTVFPTNKKDYERVKVKSIKVSNLIKRTLKNLKNYKLEYVKIDTEGSDLIILEDLFKNGIYPANLSVELQDAGLIPLIYNSPYQSFKIKNFELPEFDKKNSFFYGDDLSENYLNKEEMLKYFIVNKIGWIDLVCNMKKKKYEKFKELNIDFFYQSNSISKKIKKILKILFNLDPKFFLRIKKIFHLFN